MTQTPTQVCHSEAIPERTKVRITILLTLLVGVNVAAWVLAWLASHSYPVIGKATLLGTAWLAFGFGLRHAVDADHISAIDNTTRKLMQEGKRPIGVGFFFSLGHSTVVTVMCIAVALSAAYVQQHLSRWQELGGQIGTVVSGSFLYLIAIINLVVFVDLYKHWKRIQSGAQTGDEDELTTSLNQRGLLARLYRPLLALVNRSWQMYLVGFLFGLGFDTATEVGLLALGAQAGQSHTPFWVIMLFPLLFTVGMCLIDTIDGVLMLGAYGWAFMQPTRKLFYNLGITLMSILVAFVVGTYELLGILESKLSLRGLFWTNFDRVKFDDLGFYIIGAFVVAWAASALVTRVRAASS